MKTIRKLLILGFIPFLLQSPILANEEVNTIGDDSTVYLDNEDLVQELSEDYTAEELEEYLKENNLADDCPGQAKL